ncbi:unnamed protein product [Effrenium voratum]|uniref:phosphoglycerate mutase (2,3-diphosphoglycerate-dependent) n=1 Tax=Effrenium voratum TaxID=2562239 RepID=A0AA36J576_9DINO|nr:unnamed protein product [Effrenium voratum]
MAMGVTYDQQAIEGICSRLRVLVQDSFQKHLYVSAIFFADQLVALKQEPEEIYTLAECYFKNREYRGRVLHLLKKHSATTERSDQLKLLVAQSLMECRDWEAPRYLETNWPEDDGASDPKSAACLALLRGKVYEAMENLEWYEKAAQLDAYCHEALERLVGSHRLTLEREIALLKSLKLHKEDEWLRHLYAAKLAANRSSNENPLEASAEGATVLGDWKRDRRQNLRQGGPEAEGYPCEFLPKALAESGHARAAQSARYFGQAGWNVANIFTGWVDVDLSEKGLGEAKGAGELLKAEGLQVDVAYTSFLKRAIKTCNLALEAADQLYVPVSKTWRLNERMYGGLTGLDKKETVVKHGAEQVQVWRRSFDIPPPVLEKESKYHPCHEAKYAGMDPKDLPDTECLKDTIARVMPYWEETIAPMLKQGKTVFVAAHGNSIRAIVKMIEGLSDDLIPGLEIPTGTPLVYELDKDLKPIASSLAVEPLKFGRYLGDAEKIKAAAEAVKNQTKVG